MTVTYRRREEFAEVRGSGFRGNFGEYNCSSCDFETRVYVSA